MRRLIIVPVLIAAMSAAAWAVPVPWDLGLPPSIQVNFNGDGVFDQTPAPALDLGDGFPAAPVIGTELFGVANISEIDAVGSGDILWTPAAGTEMTLSFWDAVNTGSSRTFVPGALVINATYEDGARLVILQDDSADYDTTGGAVLFNTTNGNYPTVYDPADPDELVFLDLLLSSNTSTIVFSTAGGPPGSFISGTFDSTNVTILGGVGADQFQNAIKAHGGVFTLNLLPAPWLYNADTDVILTTVPAPTALLSLLSGLALLGGVRLRRKA